MLVRNVEEISSRDGASRSVGRSTMSSEIFLVRGCTRICFGALEEHVFEEVCESRCTGIVRHVTNTYLKSSRRLVGCRVGDEDAVETVGEGDVAIGACSISSGLNRWGMKVHGGVWSRASVGVCGVLVVVALWRVLGIAYRV